VHGCNAVLGLTVRATKCDKTKRPSDLASELWMNACNLQQSTDITSKQTVKSVFVADLFSTEPARGRRRFYFLFLSLEILFRVTETILAPLHPGRNQKSRGTSHPFPSPHLPSPPLLCHSLPFHSAPSLP